MGVMECFRNGCDNIMCDRLSHEHGYICNDCFDELVAAMEIAGSPMIVGAFMATPKQGREFARVPAHEWADSIFPDTRTFDRGG